MANVQQLVARFPCRDMPQQKLAYIGLGVKACPLWKIAPEVRGQPGHRSYKGLSELADNVDLFELKK